jgi:hypothetical protein
VTTLMCNPPLMNERAIRACSDRRHTSKMLLVPLRPLTIDMNSGWGWDSIAQTGGLGGHNITLARPIDQFGNFGPHVPSWEVSDQFVDLTDARHRPYMEG